jgi:hypothetical protein
MELSFVYGFFFQAGGGSFVILGIQSSGAGIMPMDIVVEKIQELVKKTLTGRYMSNSPAAIMANDPEQ